jgi:hypothetical protein
MNRFSSPTSILDIKAAISVPPSTGKEKQSDHSLLPLKRGGKKLGILPISLTRTPK